MDYLVIQSQATQKRVETVLKVGAEPWSFLFFSELCRRNKLLAVLAGNTPFAILPMLAFFRNNRNTTAVPLGLYALLTHLSALLGYVQPAAREMAPGGAMYQSLFWWADNAPFWSALVALLLVYVQALLINRLADEFRLLPDRSWLPGLFYVLIASSLPELLFLSPPLVAITFLPLALRCIFRCYKQTEVAYLVFDAALWCTMGSLFYPPVFFLLIAGFAGIGIMRSFRLREQFAFVSGVVAPFFLSWLWYFWHDNGFGFWHGQLSGYSGIYHFTPEWNLKTIFEIGILIALTLILLLSSGVYFRKKLIQAQKCISTLYWFMVVGALTILIQGDLRTTHLLVMAPAAGLFLSMTVASFRHRGMAEILHLALWGFVLSIQFI